jgi:hypothetical protein
MAMDLASEKFLALQKEFEAEKTRIKTEQDARFQVVDRMLLEVLGWPRALIKTEPHISEGYIDYLLTDGDRNLMLVEAKKVSILLSGTSLSGKGIYKISGPAMKVATDAISQAENYGFKTGTPLCVITNGFQWIAHWINRGDGKPPSGCKVITFSNLDSIAKNFADFYDLFSYEAVQRKTYKACFNQAEGLHILTGEKLRAIRDPRDAKHLQRSDLARDLDSIFKAFFSSMSGEDDPEMLARCFVETKESRDAEASLEKIARNLVENIEMIPTQEAGALQQEIRDAVERNTKEFALIVGNKGAGKSTFIERFFDLTLERRLRDQCLLLKVDLRDSDGDIKNVQQWLTNQLVDRAEKALFGKKTLDYEDLQGIFHRQYQQWADGEFRHLYQTDKTAFKIKFGEYVHQIRENDKSRYLAALLWHATGARKLMPCLVYDNTDHFPQLFQEAVFQYAQSLYRNCFSFVICPITDRTIWQLSKAGPLQSYDTKAFYLPIPSTKEVLEKRVAFIKAKIATTPKQSEQYFLNKGIRLSIPNLSAFAACVEEVFINTDYVSRTVSWLCNFDIRRSLALTQKILASPHISIDELVRTYLSDRRLLIHEHTIRKALMLGDYNQYNAEASDYVLNLFSIFSDCPSSPFTRLSILQLLKDKDASKDGPEQAYMETRDIESYLDAMGCAPNAVRKHLEKLLIHRCVEPYDPTEIKLTDDTRLKVTSAGLIHIEFALTDHTYVEHVGLMTEVREAEKIDRIRQLFSGNRAGNRRFDSSDWREAGQLFAAYCVEQDLLFCAVPTSYAGQMQVRHEFCVKWEVSA